jgi:hypothetical protein
VCGKYLHSQQRRKKESVTDVCRKENETVTILFVLFGHSESCFLGFGCSLEKTAHLQKRVSMHKFSFVIMNFDFLHPKNLTLPTKLVNAERMKRDTIHLMLWKF